MSKPFRHTQTINGMIKLEKKKSRYRLAGPSGTTWTVNFKVAKPGPNLLSCGGWTSLLAPARCPSAPMNPYQPKGRIFLSPDSRVPSFIFTDGYWTRAPYGKLSGQTK